LEIYGGNKTKKCDEIIQKAVEMGKSSLLISEARQICKLHNIPTPESYVAKNEKEAEEKANQIGYPVALKILSPQIVHKTDAGGVELNINNDKELREAYQEMMTKVTKNKPDAELIGILVEEMMKPSNELIVGGIRDSQFGPSVMFGMGGIFAEVYQDVAFRVAPLDEIDASELINSIEGSKILKGLRGEPPADVQSIVKILLNVSNIMMEHKKIKQLDLNPVKVYSDFACAVDSRIILNDSKEESG
jgi:acyl-CoA synthetase (NDP forming)